ncbi:bacterial low temperature requirement A protein-domain-containing protein [Kockovaella imperatae]|uniref:Bacterial low temperature requirement A protein-domain-containing protein n=1 Tax=Kockovaella imperatae TaxID=4999 RepID=A0A1Y1UEE6_9TREE|nr:bacterial low temperature requirement A protein-domain-containing protein [Kockovaella imperatae]ORX35876.1 bacterial low temperature requirement A protein-domain-containing protein [Kockovaella imperatae]
MNSEAVVPPTTSHPSSPPHPFHHNSQHDMVQKFGGGSHMFYHDKEYEALPATRVRDLVRPPVIRQYVEGGRIYREASPREVNRFELFFDLLFVAIIHIQAEAAVDEPGGPAVLRFVLTFWPSWSIWEEARKYANVSGTDDLLHRVWILVGMICITGYSINASAIELHPHGEEEKAMDHSAVQAAVAFWLTIKLTRVLVLWLYAWRLPDFRQAQFFSGLAVLVPMLVYFPLLFVTSRKAQIILAILGIVVDVIRLDLIFFAIRGHVHQWKLRKEYHRTDAADRGPAPEQFKLHRIPSLPDHFRIPAMNIEHAIDRSSAFVVIVLGELVMNLLFIGERGEIGLSPAFGRAALCLVVAWSLNYLYIIPSDPNANYEHALRRSFISGILFSFLHWPLCASLTLASAASGHMVRDNHVDVSLAWYWGCGLGFAILFGTFIDLTHRELLPRSASRIPRFARSVVQVLAGLALIFFPFGCENLTSLALIGVAVAITLFLVVMHVYGSLPRKSYLLSLDNSGEGNRGSHFEPGSKEAEAENRLRRQASKTAHVVEDRDGLDHTLG